METRAKKRKRELELLRSALEGTIVESPQAVLISIRGGDLESGEGSSYFVTSDAGSAKAAADDVVHVAYALRKVCTKSPKAVINFVRIFGMTKQITIIEELGKPMSSGKYGPLALLGKGERERRGEGCVAVPCSTPPSSAPMGGGRLEAVFTGEAHRLNGEARKTSTSVVEPRPNFARRKEAEQRERGACVPPWTGAKELDSGCSLTLHTATEELLDLLTGSGKLGGGRGNGAASSSIVLEFRGAGRAGERRRGRRAAAAVGEGELRRRWWGRRATPGWIRSPRRLSAQRRRRST
uniref:Uncharacterized protein n=1 Tax=Oryza punctata TaxID=4537 RepID=A0A0E0L3A2_ORYPU